METPINVAFAGSSKNALKIAQALEADERYDLNWIITPRPKKVGRWQELTPNPLHQWAVDQSIKSHLVNKKVQTSSVNYHQPDYLLVVDFGYIIPEKLLKLPKKAPLNIHPSALPSWRGSSPGQFVLLSGEKTSAVTLIKLTSSLDAGPIIAQQTFKVNQDWTSADYYQHSFSLAAKLVPEWINDHFLGKITEESQPEKGSTPFARKISKDDAFLPWKILKNIEKGSLNNSLKNFLAKNSLLSNYLRNESVENWPYLVERACRAFQPWPMLWTIAPTTKGEKRVQIIGCKVVEKESRLSLQLEEVKIEGKNPTKWNEVKNFIKNRKQTEN